MYVSKSVTIQKLNDEIIFTLTTYNLNYVSISIIGWRCAAEIPPPIWLIFCSILRVRAKWVYGIQGMVCNHCFKQHKTLQSLQCHDTNLELTCLYRTAAVSVKILECLNIFLYLQKSRWNRLSCSELFWCNYNISCTTHYSCHRKIRRLVAVLLR